jgi:hypothetical protein
LEGQVWVRKTFAPGTSNEDAKAPAGWTVKLLNGDGSIAASTTTNSSGAYQMKLPPPPTAHQGSQKIAIYAGTTYLGGSNPNSNQALPISTATPSISVIDFHLFPHLDDFAITGTVVGPAGTDTAPPNLAVTVEATYTAPDGTTHTATATSHAFGAYQLLLRPTGPAARRTSHSDPLNTPQQHGTVKVTLLENNLVIDSTYVQSHNTSQGFTDGTTNDAPDLNG